MSSRDLNQLHPALKAKATVFLERCKREITTAEVRIICTYRSNTEQDSMFAKGRTTMGAACRCGGKQNLTKGSCKKHPMGLIVTNAKAGQSRHNDTLDGKPAARAFDFGVFLADGSYESSGRHPAWKQAGHIAQEIDLNWFGAAGSKFYELAHCQLK